MPGVIMRSVIPCTARSSTSSARRNASIIVIFSSTSRSLELGIVISVSTQPRSSAKPCSACAIRFLPSTANGLVTIATVKAPSSIASEATTGAAPVPVPPPKPAVTNTISEPSSTSSSFSVSSRAAARPISGLDPAPSPRVDLLPSCIFIGAFEAFKACRSVLATINSTPLMPASIIRFTALLPPPPTPITLIRAPVIGGSSINILMPWFKFLSSISIKFPIAEIAF